jgi:hypothetical protein
MKGGNSKIAFRAGLRAGVVIKLSNSPPSSSFHRWLSAKGRLN